MDQRRVDLQRRDQPATLSPLQQRSRCSLPMGNDIPHRYDGTTSYC